MTQSSTSSFQKIAQQSEVIYLEPRLVELGKKKAGFHLAFAFAQLDGMTGIIV